MLLSEILGRLFSHTPPLAPTGQWDHELGRHITALSLQGYDTAVERNELLLKAGLHLWNGNLDASHRLSQEVETPLGSYWHGLMHRMEGDYGNANYWFGRAGWQPIHELLQPYAADLLMGQEAKWQRTQTVGLHSKLDAIRCAPVWTPAAFTSAVELCVRSADAVARPLLEAIQAEEIKLLVDYSYEQGGGTTVDTR